MAGTLSHLEKRLIEPRASLDEYLAAGGGRGLERLRTLSAEDVINIVSDSGLRGRGGAGFPTGTKWRSILSGSGERFLVCNAAEGEPATFKDRLLLRRNPYSVLEGITIAASTLGIGHVYIGLKASFTLEAETLVRAIGEMRRSHMLDGLHVELVHGPDRYLLGEETGLLAVIEGRGPFPREIRPFMQGLFGSPSSANTTLVNNVETLANVPAIVALGADWFRSCGTDSSPGTMLFTVAGDVVREGVFELPLGTPLRELLEQHAGGAPDGRRIKAVLPGASSAVITNLDVPLDFDLMRAAGSGLGAGGFAAYDESACMVDVTRLFTRFLHVESCAQCQACKLNSGTINELTSSLHAGTGSLGDPGEILARAEKVTDGQKCALPTGTKLLVLSMLHAFGDEFATHAEGECPLPRDLVFPKLIDYDDEAGKFLYDRAYAGTSPQWTDEPEGGSTVEV
jgi:NADH:ubiquinone oxidoreductase subunit F (NADH-binding)